MANSRKSKRADVALHASRTLSRLVTPGSRLCLALSGGVDSVVLLDVLDALKRDLCFQLVAVHVNHQQSAQAGEWAEFCKKLCAAREIPIEVADIEIPRGTTQEATARALRYEIFSDACADFVVLAHTLDDQVETIFLRLLRGAGVDGLSGMREIRIHDSGFGIEDSEVRKQGSRFRSQGSGVRIQESGARNQNPGVGSARSSLIPYTSSLAPMILRPLLNVPRSEILAYARAHALEWIEDDSNRDERFDRNFLRQRALPLVETRWPRYRELVARAQENLADAARALEELATLDATSCMRDGTIVVADLERLSATRRRNLLRYFVRERGCLMPDRSWLDQALHQLVDSRPDSRACAVLGEVALRRYRGSVHFVKNMPAAAKDWRAAWQGEREVVLPNASGVVEFARMPGEGVSLSRLRTSEATIRFRRGGERFRPHPRRPRRSLKNLLQENALPPWDRERLPLLFSGDTLVWAAGIGIDVAFQCTPHEEGVVPLWRR
jgi:tRNA(Ile)-lysidine synthase